MQSQTLGNLVHYYLGYPWQSGNLSSFSFSEECYLRSWEWHEQGGQHVC